MTAPTEEPRSARVLPRIAAVLLVLPVLIGVLFIVYGVSTLFDPYGTLWQEVLGLAFSTAVTAGLVYAIVRLWRGPPAT